MSTQNNYLSASDARKLTEYNNSTDHNDTMNVVMSLIKEAISRGDNYISVNYHEFCDVSNNLQKLEYTVTVTYDNNWMNIRW